jgi:hypothetical protein
VTAKRDPAGLNFAPTQGQRTEILGATVLPPLHPDEATVNIKSALPEICFSCSSLSDAKATIRTTQLEADKGSVHEQAAVAALDFVGMGSLATVPGAVGDVIGQMAAPDITIPYCKGCLRRDRRKRPFRAFGLVALPVSVGLAFLSGIAAGTVAAGAVVALVLSRGGGVTGFHKSRGDVLLRGVHKDVVTRLLANGTGW